MGGLVDSIFNPGGAAKDAAKAQTQATEKAMEEYRKGVAEAKQEISNVTGDTANQRTMRYGDMAQALSGMFAPSLDVAQQGSLNAQNAILAGGNNAMNALLGGQIDPNAMQARGIDFNAQDFMSNLQGLQRLQSEAEAIRNPATPSPDIGQVDAGGIPVPDQPQGLNPISQTDPFGTGFNPYDDPNYVRNLFQNIGLNGNTGLYTNPYNYPFSSGAIGMGAQQLLGGAFQIPSSPFAPQ